MEEDEIASIECDLEEFESNEVKPHENKTLSLVGENNSSDVHIVEDNPPIPYNTLTDFL